MKTFILSQDYELFFGTSGSPEKCLFEPCDALLRTAARHNIQITFFVDVGMLVCMRSLAKKERMLSKRLSMICNHIESLAAAGHEIALHIHPHWEDTRWSEGRWDFSATRYQLRDFSSDEVTSIVSRYSNFLGDIVGNLPKSYRAGGFCVEPFAALATSLASAGVFIDSSVVPGFYLDDPDKGVDFRRAPDSEYWRFSSSPCVEDRDGPFVEIPVGVQTLPLTYYWGRLFRRLTGQGTSAVYGDGSSKRIGRAEVVRRLLGSGRLAELSADYPKSDQLARQEAAIGRRKLWQVMGHPKLLSDTALAQLEAFFVGGEFDRSTTICTVGSEILSASTGGLGTR